MITNSKTLIIILVLQQNYPNRHNFYRKPSTSIYNNVIPKSGNYQQTIDPMMASSIQAETDFYQHDYIVIIQVDPIYKIQISNSLMVPNTVHQ